jgi:hypothetical protein
MLACPVNFVPADKLGKLGQEILEWRSGSTRQKKS